MLTILLGFGPPVEQASEFSEALRSAGAVVHYWETGSPLPVAGVDSVIVLPKDLDTAREQAKGALRRPRLIVAVETATPDDTRRLITSGADAMIKAQGVPTEQAMLAIAASTGCCILPDGHGLELAQRLESPPRPLTPEEQDLLALAATMSIEAAGERLGYSRRQVQRRFGLLCRSLNLDDHRMAAIAAAKWGLLNSQP